MTTSAARRLRPGRPTARSPYALDIDPARAGWGYSSLRVLDLPPGGSHHFETGDSEWIVLPLRGGCTLACEGRTLELRGRRDVFAGVSDFGYVPCDARAELTSAAGGRFALAGARATRRMPVRYGPAEDVAVELRGAGTCSRQVHNFAAADRFAADRLIAVEVLTPGGNWSSYPPHKHDEDVPGEESVLEEIYYYEVEGGGTAIQQVTASDGTGEDLLTEVRGGDAVLIPRGWHGPSIAAPGHTLYYLNVMAGPGAERRWLIRDHPGHADVRTAWKDQDVDPRLPLHRPGGGL